MHDVAVLDDAALVGAGMSTLKICGPQLAAHRLRSRATTVIVERADIIEMLNLNCTLTERLAGLRKRVEEIAATAPEATAAELNKALDAARF